LFVVLKSGFISRCPKAKFQRRRSTDLLSSQCIFNLEKMPVLIYVIFLLFQQIPGFEITQNSRHPPQSLGFRSLADWGIPPTPTSATLLGKMNCWEWHMRTPKHGLGEMLNAETLHNIPVTMCFNFGDHLNTLCCDTLPHPRLLAHFDILVEIGHRHGI